MFMKIKFLLFFPFVFACSNDGNYEQAPSAYVRGVQVERVDPEPIIEVIDYIVEEKVEDYIVEEKVEHPQVEEEQIVPVEPDVLVVREDDDESPGSIVELIEDILSVSEEEEQVPELEQVDPITSIELVDQPEEVIPEEVVEDEIESVVAAEETLTETSSVIAEEPVAPEVLPESTDTHVDESVADEIVEETSEVVTDETTETLVADKEPVVIDEKVEYMHRCFWMENFSGSYKWIFAEEGGMYNGEGKDRCMELDSCSGGGGLSGGGCYKWDKDLTSPIIKPEPVEAKKSCQWMENLSGNYSWVPAEDGGLYNGEGKDRCIELDSCYGGGGLSFGGCYKWK